MKELQAKVAVVTGSASGIGLAIAKYRASEGMKVVLCDIEKDALIKVEKEMSSEGIRVMPVATDVLKGDEIQALAQKVLDTLGGVDLQFNNAGVFSFKAQSAWETSIAEFF